MFKNKELLEMANIPGDRTGIIDVVIWIGPSHNGHRIKISNIPNKADINDTFKITIPDYKIIGKVNSNFIDKDKLDNIKKFIKLNKELIIKYSNHEIFTTDLIENIKKI